MLYKVVLLKEEKTGPLNSWPVIYKIKFFITIKSLLFTCPAKAIY